MTGHRRRGTSGLEPLRGFPRSNHAITVVPWGPIPDNFGDGFPRRQFHCTTGVKKRAAHPTRATARQGRERTRRMAKDEAGDKAGDGRTRKNGGGTRRRRKNEGGRRRDGQTTRQVTKGRERTKEDGEGTGVRPRSRSSRAVTRLARRLDSLVRESNEPASFAFGRFGSMQANAEAMQRWRKHRCRGMQAYASIDAGECKHMQASMQHGCRSDAARVQHGCRSDAARVLHGCRSDAARVLHGCCIDAEECKHAQASMQERCSTGAGAMQHGCCIDAEGANAGSASMLCVHSIALHAGVSGIDGAGKRNMLAVCLHCLHFSEQRITARRGGKRGVRGEMRGIVRRVPTCGAFRRAAGGRREDEEDEKDYGERRQRRGIVRRVPTCGAFRRRRLRPIRPLLRHRC